MRKLLSLSFLAFWAFISVSSAQSDDPDPGNQLKPIELVDILAWKSIRSEVVSVDGNWFAYRLSPNEGDSQVIIRETRGPVSYSFPAGESSGGKIAFSEDGKWAAFSVSPSREEAKKLKSSKKKSYNGVALVEISTGERTEFEKVNNFEFSGRNPDWIAFHRYPNSEKNGEDQPTGSDLILRELASGKEFNIGNVSEFQFDKYGRWCVITC